MCRSIGAERTARRRCLKEGRQLRRSQLGRRLSLLMTARRSFAYSSMIRSASSRRESLGGGLSFGPSDGFMPQRSAQNQEEPLSYIKRGHSPSEGSPPNRAL